MRIGLRVFRGVSATAGLASIAATAALAVGEISSILRVVVTLVAEGSVSGAWSAFLSMWSGLRSVGAIFTLGGITAAILVFAYGLAKAINLIASAYMKGAQRTVTVRLRDTEYEFDLEDPGKVRAMIEGVRKERES